MAGKLYKTGMIITGDASQGVRVLQMTQKQLAALDRQMGKTGKSADRMSRRTQTLFGNMNSLKGILAQFGPAMSAFSAGFVVRNIIDASLAMDGYTRAIEAVTGGTAAAARELDFLRKEAQRVGVEFQPLVREFAKLAAAARHTKLEGDGIRETFSSLIEYSRVLNLSSEDTRGAIFALQQMISKGTVSAEELRRQLGERLPGAFSAMARAVGVSTQELDRMLKQGQLITEDVLPGFSRELEKMAAAGLKAAQQMPAAQFARLKNAIFELNVEAGKDLLPLLADGAVALTKALEVLGPHIGTATRLLLGLGAAKFLGPMFNALGRELKLLPLRLQVASVGMTTATAKANALAASARLLKGAMAGLGGPAGVILMAGGAWWAYSEAQKQAREEAEAATEAINKQIDAMDTLGKSSTQQLIDNASEQMSTIFDELLEKRQELANLKAPDWVGFVPDDDALLIQQLSKQINYLELRYAELEKAAADAGVRLSQFDGDADVAADAADDLAQDVKKTVDALTAKAKQLDNTRDALLRYGDDLLKNVDLTDDQREALKKAIKNLEGKLATNKKLKESEKALNKQIGDGAKLWQDYLKSVDPTAAAMMELDIQTQSLEAAAKKYGWSQEMVAEAVDWLRQQHEELRSGEENLHLTNEKLIEDAEEYLKELQAENAALALATEKSIDLATAKLILAGAEQDLIDATQAAIEENKNLSESYEDLTKDNDIFTKAVKRGVERLDDAFADFWRSLLTGGGNAFDSLKRMAIDTFAEIMHALTTRRLTTAIVGAFLPAGSAMAGGVATGGGLGSLFSGGGALASMFTGNGIGMGLQNLPTWMGGTSQTFAGGAGMNTAGGLFGNAAAIPNWGFGLAGLAGYFGGDMLFGGKGGMGASLGAMIGLATPLGPLGAIAGGLIGGWLGGLIKDRPSLLEVGTQSRAGESNSDYDKFIQSAFGGVNVRSRRVDDSDADAFGQALADFDNNLAQFLDSGQIELITGALENWRIKMEGESISLEDTLTNRWGVILSTFEDDVRAFVNGAEGIEEQVAKLGQALTAQAIIDSSPDLFDGRTWQDFIVVAEAMREEGEELADTFTRLVTQMQVLAAATATLQGFSDSNLENDYLALVEANNQTAFGAWQASRDIFNEAINTFDGTADSVLNLAQLTERHYETELAALLAVDEAMSAINSSLNSSIDQIEADLRSPTENYDHYSTLAEQAAASLMGMTDPEMIRQTLEDINRWTNQAYGYLDEDQKASMGGEIVEFLKEVRGIGNEQLEEAKSQILTTGEIFREEVGIGMSEIKDPLLLVANELGISAEDLKAAAADLSDAANNQGVGVEPYAPGSGAGTGGKDGRNKLHVESTSGGNTGNFQWEAQQEAPQALSVDVDVDTQRLEKVVYAGSVNNHNAVAALITAINSLITSMKSRPAQIGGSVK